MEKSREDLSRGDVNLTPIFLAQELHRRDLLYFTSRDLMQLFALTPARAYRLLQQLKSTGLIAEIENGKYLLLGFEPERVLSNPLFVASQIVSPAYVSYWSALHYYGFTEQVPHVVTVATTKKKRPMAFLGQEFRYVTIQPRKFFGYQRLTVDRLPVIIADEAKATIDSLDQPRYAGGIGEVAKALAACLTTVGVRDLVAYAEQMADRSLASRLGYLLDTLAEDRSDAAAITEAIKGLSPSSKPIKLDPARPASASSDERSQRWRVVPNFPLDQLFPGGVV